MKTNRNISMKKSVRSLVKENCGKWATYILTTAIFVPVIEALIPVMTLLRCLPATSTSMTNSHVTNRELRPMNMRIFDVLVRSFIS